MEVQGPRMTKIMLKRKNKVEAHFDFKSVDNAKIIKTVRRLVYKDRHR